MTDEPPFAQLVEWVGYGIDLLGVGIITLGILLASFVALRRWRAGSVLGEDLFRSFRRDVGQAILIGLELLVAADILRTVAIAPSVENVLVLALIVAVRTFLSFSLEVELYGQWPWRRGTARGNGNGAGGS